MIFPRTSCNLDNFNYKSIEKNNSTPLRVTNIYDLIIYTSNGSNMIFTHIQIYINLQTMFNLQ